jgi:4-carboxymuconolactone decarboxylase
VQRLGEYLRHRSALGLLLSELAILLVARHGSQLAEWAIHAPPRAARRRGTGDRAGHWRGGRVPTRSIQNVQQERHRGRRPGP